MFEPHAVLYSIDAARADALAASLGDQGIDARGVSAFRDVPAWLILFHGEATLVLDLPRRAWQIAALLDAAQRYARRVPVVALVPPDAPAFDLARVARVLPADAAPAAIADAVRATARPMETPSGRLRRATADAELSEAA
jgi:hypothetical protein